MIVRVKCRANDQEVSAAMHDMQILGAHDWLYMKESHPLSIFILSSIGDSATVHPAQLVKILVE